MPIWQRKKFSPKRAYRNPYFSRSSKLRRGGPKPLKRQAARALTVILAATFLLGVPAMLLLHPAFRITEIDYDLQTVLEERKTNIRQAVEATLGGVRWPGFNIRNIFLVPTKDIAAAIRQTGAYQEIKLKRRLPNQLRISVRQALPVFLARSGQTEAILDQNGEALEIFESGPEAQARLAEISTSSLIFVEIAGESSSTPAITAKTEFIPKNCATLILALRQGLEILGIEGQSYTVSSDHTTVTMLEKNGWKLLTDPIVPTSDQLERLAAALRDPRYRNLKAVDYIDVRFPDRVYVKMKQ